jgi:ribose transport system permease protein
VTAWAGRNGIIAATVLLFVVLSVASNRFLTQNNLFNILDQQAGLGIIACAVTFVIIAGGFDLSVGATFALTAVASAQVATATNPAVGLLSAVAIGIIVGAANGTIVTFGRVPSFIATLATAIVLSGLGLIVTGGYAVSVADPAFGVIGQGRFLGLRWAAWLFLLIGAILWFVLARTTFGRYVYAVGGNPEAARLSGLRVEWIRFGTFVMAGAAAGIGGMIEVSRVNSAQAGIGGSLALTAVAAVVIGGTSIAGGSGAIWRTLLGVLFLAFVSNGFNLLGIESTYQQICQGVLILLAIALSVWAQKKK